MIGGKIAPTPALSAKCCRIQALAFWIAAVRTACGPHFSSHLTHRSTARKKLAAVNQRLLGWCGQSGVSCGLTNNSAIPKSGGSCRTGLYAEKIVNGTTMVRVQLDMA